MRYAFPDSRNARGELYASGWWCYNLYCFCRGRDAIGTVMKFIMIIDLLLTNENEIQKRVGGRALGLNLATWRLYTMLIVTTL